MSTHKKPKAKIQAAAPPIKRTYFGKILLVGIILIGIVLLVMYYRHSGNEPVTNLTNPQDTSQHSQKETPAAQSENVWIQRTEAIDELFHYVYTPCWEGAYGAIGDAYLFAVDHDSSLLRFHLIDHDLRNMCVGRWVDDRAWVCLAEFKWWEVTGRNNFSLVDDAKHRYMEARDENRFGHPEGFWSWYNWPPESNIRENIFTNSNMNQMLTVACWLYEATGEKQFLRDALLAWNGDSKYPGIEKTWYKGDGRWEGKPGLAAFGKQVPWEGAGYCSVGAALYRATKDVKYKKIVVATAKRIMDPANNWIDPQSFYQIKMDGNGAFVNFLLDAYSIAPDELSDLLPKIETMLDNVWSNHDGTASLTLHRESDNGIRNGWNPYGGEDGYNVNEVGTVHAQGEAVRAFGIFTYFKLQKR